MQDFRENPNKNLREAYASTEVENDRFDDAEMELDLASPWQRIGARILDVLPFAFCCYRYFGSHFVALDEG